MCHREDMWTLSRQFLLLSSRCSLSVFYLFNSILLLQLLQKRRFYCESKHIVGSIGPAWVMNSSEFFCQLLEKEKKNKKKKRKGEAILTQSREEEYFGDFGGEKPDFSVQLELSKRLIFSRLLVVQASHSLLYSYI